MKPKEDGQLTGRMARRRVVRMTVPSDGFPGRAVTRADLLATRHGRLSPQHAYARWTEACAVAGWRGCPAPEEVHVADGRDRVLAEPGGVPAQVAVLERLLPVEQQLAATASVM